ncbi:MAG TPA: amidase [Solirubrobacteraceae bacterium]|nr:amidase [Solirubrobacteraceae bacterium]
MAVDAAELTVSRARAEIENGSLSPVELTEAVLERIFERNRELNAYLYVDEDGARAQARAAEEQDPAPERPLRGIPICVKDIIDVADMPTTAGADHWRRDPAADAASVARLRAAGAVIVGKGNTNEFAYGIDGQNPHWGDAGNPHDPERITGGSTSGPAAAVAGGLALAGLGTDTGGSLRVPASLCGVTGFRPTLGSVPLGGVVALAWSFDVAGPIARTAEDCGVLLDVLQGRPVAVPSPSPAGLRVGLLAELLAEHSEPHVAEGVERAAETLRAQGAQVVEVRPRDLHLAPAVFRTIQLVEASRAHAKWFNRQRERYAPRVRDLLECGRLLPADAYVAAQQARRLLVDEIADTVREHRLDALLAPATPVTAPRRDAETVTIGEREVPVRAALLSMTAPISLLGGPAAAVPAGTHEGMPFGAQIVARPGAEETVLRIATALQATDLPR